MAPEDIRPAIETTREGREEFFTAVAAAIEAQPAVFADGEWEDGELTDSGRLTAAVEENFFPGHVTADADAEWEEWNSANC